MNIGEWSLNDLEPVVQFSVSNHFCPRSQEIIDSSV